MGLEGSMLAEGVEINKASWNTRSARQGDKRLCQDGNKKRQKVPRSRFS